MSNRKNLKNVERRALVVQYFISKLGRAASVRFAEQSIANVILWTRIAVNKIPMSEIEGDGFPGEAHAIAEVTKCLVDQGKLNKDLLKKAIFQALNFILSDIHVVRANLIGHDEIDWIYKHIRETEALVRGDSPAAIIFDRIIQPDPEVEVKTFQANTYRGKLKERIEKPGELHVEALYKLKVPKDLKAEVKTSKVSTHRKKLKERKQV